VADLLTRTAKVDRPGPDNSGGIGPAFAAAPVPWVLRAAT